MPAVLVHEGGGCQHVPASCLQLLSPMSGPHCAHVQCTVQACNIAGISGTHALCVPCAPPFPLHTQVHNEGGRKRVVVTKNLPGQRWLDILTAADCR
jgi:hypothetical protein